MRAHAVSSVLQPRGSACVFFAGVALGVCFGTMVGIQIGGNSSSYSPLSISMLRKEESALLEVLKSGHQAGDAMTALSTKFSPPLRTDESDCHQTQRQPATCSSCPACTDKCKNSADDDATLGIEEALTDDHQAKAGSEATQLQPESTFDSPSNVQQNLRDRQRHLFPESTSHFMTGMSRIDRQQFAKSFDIGYAWDPETPNTRDVLLLYTSEESMPGESGYLNGSIPNMPLDHALQNCHTVKTVLIQPIWQQSNGITWREKECIAIVPQWASYHVHKFQRMHEGKVLATDHYGNWTYMPARELGKSFYDPAYSAAGNKALVSYLQALDEALEKLRPLVLTASLGANGAAGPVIVLVTNFGQSNLLLNLVCSAKSRNVDLSRVVLFATDQETFELAQHLHLHVFFDPSVFGSIPKGAGNDYGSKKYAYAMLAKVYSVHLPLLLGHDVLFMDVDIALYKDPLVFFKEQKTSNFDMYFQHDGFHHPERFAPLAANTGIYFVRNNERTLHFFDQLVRLGDQILINKSHQAVVTSLVNEHMSRTGLRVKILSDYQDLMPNGWALQTGRKIIQYMRAQFEPQLPILFHPNWRTKERKREAFISTHNWFLEEHCYIVDGDELDQQVVKAGILDSCCLAEPLPAVSWKEWERKRGGKKRKMMKKRTAR